MNYECFWSKVGLRGPVIGVAERPPSVCVCFGLEEAVRFNWD